LIILCECGEIVDDDNIFEDYIKTSANPSTHTIGHKKCGHIFNFIGGSIPKKYSSKKELKSIALKFAEKNKMDCWSIGRFLLDIDRLKSSGNLSDGQILATAFRNTITKRREF